MSVVQRGAAAGVDAVRRRSSRIIITVVEIMIVMMGVCPVVCDDDGLLCGSRFGEATVARGAHYLITAFGHVTGTVEWIEHDFFFIGRCCCCWPEMSCVVVVVSKNKNDSPVVLLRYNNNNNHHICGFGVAFYFSSVLRVSPSENIT